MICDIELLKKNILFRGLTEQEFQVLLEPDACILGRYKKNTVIVHENELCRSVGYIMEGILSYQQIAPTGEMIKIHLFYPGECFGQTIIFASRPVYAYTLVTSSPAVILYIQAEKIKALLAVSRVFCNNFTVYLSDTMRLAQDKVRILSQRDVRSRLILYLSDAASRTGCFRFKLPNSKTEIADLIGVARPSVSRELKRMQTDGLIVLEGGWITILSEKEHGAKSH